MSPIGAADNVLAAVRPGDVRDYVYEVPENHPTGTYWLHAHFHGSSAYETAYSMASALLVRAKGQGVSTHVQEFVALIQNVEVGTASGSDATRLAQEIEAGSAESWPATDCFRGRQRRAVAKNLEFLRANGCV